MAWSLKTRCNPDFQTLEELREQIRAEESVSILSVEDDNIAADIIDERAAAPRRRQKRVATGEPRKRAAKDGGSHRRKRREEEEEEEEDLPSCAAMSPSCNDGKDSDKENDATDLEAEMEAVAEAVADAVAEVEAESDMIVLHGNDLALAASTINSDLKSLCARISALASVLTDAQTASTARALNLLNKEIDNLRLLATGCSQQLKKRVRTKRTVRA